MHKYNLTAWIKEYKSEYNLSNKCISDLKKVINTIKIHQKIEHDNKN